MENDKNPELSFGYTAVLVYGKLQMFLTIMLVISILPKLFLGDFDKASEGFGVASSSFIIWMLCEEVIMQQRRYLNSQKGNEDES